MPCASTFDAYIERDLKAGRPNKKFGEMAHRHVKLRGLVYLEYDELFLTNYSKYGRSTVVPLPKQISVSYIRSLKSNMTISCGLTSSRNFVKQSIHRLLLCSSENDDLRCPITFNNDDYAIRLLRASDDRW